ncbi:type I-E CRISPR-associated protein Cse2/CasB [Actinomadura harenae]|uniref:Type I-E CRISPR-associated protein Cse2/CasB n=1 Tax=Actinomadura harenae TaxID=2483351 RepID=A0A3M2M5J5_9ACTN|nr:type I-E CRISPR-associated protein Cse2/CasB [Actinomadura harenae]RMI44093.1 type I-E CRISPR-associated protein Cse2/CasB [Actinomadura harenae]
MTDESSSAESISPTPFQARYVKVCEFVDQVHELCRYPGDRAALRTGLGRPLDRCHRMHRVIAARVPSGGMDQERAYYAVAAMIAALPPHARGLAPRSGTQARNLGVCLAEGVGRGTLRESSAEARLSLLTRQSIDGIHRHLPSTVRVLADSSTAIDWAQLLMDLSSWTDYRDRITRRWLQSFYRTRFRSEDTDAQPPAPSDQPTSKES